GEHCGHGREVPSRRSRVVVGSAVSGLLSRTARQRPGHDPYRKAGFVGLGESHGYVIQNLIESVRLSQRGHACVELGRRTRAQTANRLARAEVSPRGAMRFGISVNVTAAAKNLASVSPVAPPSIARMYCRASSTAAVCFGPLITFDTPLQDSVDAI